MHTASLVAALHCAAEELPSGARVLLIAAGAGITAGAALYREGATPMKRRIPQQ
jgi:3-oxoacyl-[acyl-carrier-protein] synthase-3